jgi:hypothetical protein
VPARRAGPWFRGCGVVAALEKDDGAGRSEPALAGQDQYAVVQPGDSFALQLETRGVTRDAERSEGALPAQREEIYSDVSAHGHPIARG